MTLTVIAGSANVPLATSIAQELGLKLCGRASGREAVGARVVAGLIEAAGFDRVVAIDLHVPEIEGFFHIPLEHLSAAKLLAQAVRTTSDTVIVARNRWTQANQWLGVAGCSAILSTRRRLTANPHDAWQSSGR